MIVIETGHKLGVHSPFSDSPMAWFRFSGSSAASSETHGAMLKAFPGELHPGQILLAPWLS